MKWLSHASFQIVTDGVNIYIDSYGGDYVDKADLILVKVVKKSIEIKMDSTANRCNEVCLLLESYISLSKKQWYDEK